MAGIEVASLFGTLDLIDNLTPGLRSADQNMGSFADRLGGLGDRVAGFGARMTALTAPITAFGVAGVMTASSFEDAMAEISARTGIVGDDLTVISDLALQMGADTAFSAQQAADAFLQLLSSGQTAEEAIATLPAVLDAAAASGEDLGMTADLVTDIMASFGLGVESAGGVVDALARAAGASSADIASLGQGFGNVGSVARSFGLSVDETSAILAIFSENGIKGAEAGTQLRSMLLAMSADTETAKGAWNRIGTSMFDAQGNMRPMTEILRDITEATVDMTDQEKQQLFRDLGGAYGIMGLQALTSGMSIEDMLGRMDESASASEIAEARMNTFSGAIDSLTGSIETLQTKVLTPLIDNFLKPLVVEVTALTNKVTAWAELNPELASTIGAVATVGGVLLAALIPIGLAMGAVGAALGFVLSPIGLVIGAVVALGAAYATNFGGIRDFVDNEVRPRLEAFFGWLGGVWETTIRPGLEALYNWFVTDALPAVGNFVTNTVLPAVQDFFNFLGDVWELVRPALESIATWFIEDALPAISNFVTNTVAPAVQDFFNILEGAWLLVSVSLQALYQWFMTDGLPWIQQAIETVQRVWGELQTGLMELWGRVQPVVQPIVDWFRDTFQMIGENYIRPVLDFVQSIIDRVREALDALRTLGGGTTTGSVGGVTGTIYPGGIGRDSGGFGYAGGAYMIGTGAQPELFVPSSNGYFIPNADRALAGAGGGGRVTINVSVTERQVLSEAAARDNGQALGEEIMRKFRARG